jgi:hypothetical protein
MAVPSTSVAAARAGVSAEREAEGKGGLLTDMGCTKVLAFRLAAL